MAGIAPPVDAEAARSAELAAVFATLDSVQRDADALVDAARLEAERIRAAAAIEAEATVARARERAAVERARVTQQRIGESAAEDEARMAAARSEAATIIHGAGTNADRVAEAVIKQLQQHAAGRPSA
ncbi:MAG: hypothetical protein WCB51_00020 [Candidatus Dormiibacterota bacterium]